MIQAGFVLSPELVEGSRRWISRSPYELHRQIFFKAGTFRLRVKDAPLKVTAKLSSRAKRSAVEGSRGCTAHTDRKPQDVPSRTKPASYAGAGQSAAPAGEGLQRILYLAGCEQQRRIVRVNVPDSRDVSTTGRSPSAQHDRYGIIVNCASLRYASATKKRSKHSSVTGTMR